MTSCTLYFYILIFIIKAIDRISKYTGVRDIYVSVRCNFFAFVVILVYVTKKPHLRIADSLLKSRLHYE